MKHLLVLFASLALLSHAPAQSASAALAADLQSADPAHWPAINELLLAQRVELTAAHTAALSAAAIEFKAQLDAATAERDAAVAKLADLQSQITTVLSSTLSDLQSQLTAAQSALTAELVTGDGPQAAAKRLIVTDLQARIDTIFSLQSEATKSDRQKAVDAALAAKAAADKALADAQAALQKP